MPRALHRWIAHDHPGQNCTKWSIVGALSATCSDHPKGVAAHDTFVGECADARTGAGVGVVCARMDSPRPPSLELGVFVRITHARHQLCACHQTLCGCSIAYVCATD